MQVKQQLAYLKALFLGLEATSSLRSRTVHSGVWIGAGFAVQKALQLCSNLILTRLLFPEAFGLMALATVLLVGLQMLSDIGLKPAVIRDPRGDEPEFLNTAWTLQVSRGFLLCVIGVAIAYPISLIYGQTILFPLLAVLSTTAAITGFMSIGMSTAERRLDFRTITIVQVVGQAASIGLLVTLAYFWRSVWALAVANVISAVVTVVIGYVLLPRHRHRFAFDRDAAKSMVNFGRWILFSTLATYLGGEGIRAIQAGFLSPAEFGVLAIAYTIAAIPNDLATKLSASLGLPVLAETYRKTPSKAYTVLHAFRLRTLVISLSLFAGLMWSAELFISFLYDARYQDASKYLVALSLAGAIAAVSSGYTGAILAVGKGALYFNIIAGVAVLRAICVILGAEENGVLGMLYGLAGANLLAAVFTWLAAYHLSLLNMKIDIGALGAIAAIWLFAVLI